MVTANVDLDNYNFFQQMIDKNHGNYWQVVHAMALTYCFDEYHYNKVLTGRTIQLEVDHIVYNCSRIVNCPLDDFFNRLIFDYVNQNPDIFSAANYQNFFNILSVPVGFYDKTCLF